MSDLSLSPAHHTPGSGVLVRYTNRAMTSKPPTLSRRTFLSAAAAGIVSGPIWAKAIAARDSDSHLLSDIEHRTFNFYWERVNHSKSLMR